MARRVLDRAQMLFAWHLSSRSDRETAHTRYDTATPQVAAAEAKLHSAQAQLHAADVQVEKAKAQGSQAVAAIEQARIDLECTVSSSYALKHSGRRAEEHSAMQQHITPVS